MESKYSTMRCRVVGCMTASCQGRILKKKTFIFYDIHCTVTTFVRRDMYPVPNRRFRITVIVTQVMRINLNANFGRWSSRPPPRLPGDAC